MQKQLYFFGSVALLTAGSLAAVAAKEKAAPAAPAGWHYVSNEALYRAVLPSDNMPSEAKVKLGEKLFLDTRLSSNGQVSCATCHLPGRAFTDGKKLSSGVGQTMRNSPTVMDAMFQPAQFWDGRAPTMEEQAKLPITNPAEMGLRDGKEAEEIVKRIPDYGPLFEKAFGSNEVTFDRIAAAIATYERKQLSSPAPFDRYIRGDQKAISPAAKRGWAVFNGQGRCLACHGVNGSGAFFNDNKFHNIGIAAHRKNFAELAKKGLAVIETGNTDQIDRLAIEDPDFTELGRFLITKNPADAGAFKTPSLRNIGVTGPYMHDGSFATLWDVIDHYNKGGIANPFLDGGIHRLGLTEPQINDIVEFLFTLTSPEFAELNRKEFSRQKALAAKSRPERDTALAMGKKGSQSDAVIPQTRKDPGQVGTF